MKYLFFICAFFLTGSDNVAMLGLKINGPEASLKAIKLKVDSEDKEAGMIKYKTANGNDLSVTCQKGKIVYLENDWQHNKAGWQPLYSDFKFGQTTLRDVRKKFGTNGFVYDQRGAFTNETDLIEFNCFEFNALNNLVLVVVTKVPLKAKVDERNVSDNLKLEAIIIADKKYLDSIWGEKKAFDKNYSKIRL